MRPVSVPVIVALTCVLATHSQARAAAPADPPAADALRAAVIESEQWLHKVDSFYVKFDVLWTRTPEGIARRTAELRKQFGDARATTERFTDLRPQSLETLVLAFDRRRLYKSVNRLGEEERLQFWDGSRAMSYERYFTHEQEGYGIAPTPEHLGQYFLGEASWPRAGRHSFWWFTLPDREGYRFDQEGAQRWTLAGREQFHGVDCWVIEKEYGWTKWYVGVERPLLHGLITYVSRRKNEATDLAVAREVAKRFEGPQVESRKAFFEWKKSLPKDRDAEVQAAYVRGTLKHAYPLAVHHMLDYKEAAPGWWFPMTQGYDIMQADGGGPPIVSVSRHFKTVELKVNEPLPDELFRMTMKEGVQVYDRTHEPPLIYKFKPKFTDAEWQAIVEEAKKNKEFWAQRKAEQDAIVGKPAPAFPSKAEWINATEPLKWEKLKGKPVIVDFFADWCAPCRNDLPTLASLHNERERWRFAVVGVHPPGSDRKSVDKLIKEFELAYPICVDVPHQGAWGKVFAAYNVKAIPHAVLVDADGKIAASGQLGEMIEKARQLAPAKK